MSAGDIRRVLVVEDDKAIADLVSMRLELMGCQTHVAGNGMDAISSVKMFRPQAMVLDINMPILDGFEVMERLGRDVMARLPTLVMTARHQTEDVRKAVSLGARDYLAKPFTDAQFLQRAARLLR